MTQPGFGSQAACLWVLRCPPSPASLDTLGPPFCWYRTLPRARPAGIERLGFQAHLCTCCRPALHIWNLGTPQFLLLCSRVPQTPFLLRLRSIAFENIVAASLLFSIGAGGKGFPAPPLQKEGRALGAGTWPWARAAPEASLSVSVFSPRKILTIQNVLALSPGGLEGFPHTVLRCFANEGSGNAKCSRVCACQRETGHGSQKRVASSN